MKWEKLVLTGDESFVTPSEYATNINVVDAKPLPSGVTESFCSHFKKATYYQTYNGTVIGFSQRTGATIPTRGFSFSLNGMTVEEFKSWLASEYAAGHPVTIWYEPETPTTATVSVPQIPTLKGTTIIDVDTELKPSEMTVEYLV